MLSSSARVPSLEEQLQQLEEQLTQEEADIAEQQQHVPTDLKGRVHALLHRNVFQISVVVLVILDSLIVVSELLIELNVLGDKTKKVCNESGHEIEEKDERLHLAGEALHYASIAILSVFVIELGLKLFAMRLSFIKHKMEVFDAVIVIVSFSLDIAFLDQEGISNAATLLIVLRLWRVTRIINGLSLTVKAQTEKKLVRLMRIKDFLHTEVKRLRVDLNRADVIGDKMKTLLEQNGLEVPRLEEDQGPLKVTEKGGFEVHLS